MIDTMQSHPPMGPDDIKALRTELGLSQRQFAKLLAVTAGYVALLEAGKRVPSERMAKRMLRLRESLLATVGAAAALQLGDDDDPWSPEDANSDSDDAFTVFVGTSGSRRSEFVDAWLNDQPSSPESIVTSVDLAFIDDDALSVYQALREHLIRNSRLRSLFPLEIRPSPSELLDLLERPNMPSVFLRFDNWNPRGMTGHQAVADLGMFARKVRVIALTQYAPPIVPGVSVVRVPDDEPQQLSETTEPSLDESPSPEDVERAVNERRGKLPASFVRFVEELDQRSLRSHPSLWIGLARELTHRGSSMDLERARAEVDNILQVELGDGLLWHALLTATDLAIIEHEYRRAEAFVDQLIHVNSKSAGAFDIGPVFVMRARALWEQSRFSEALGALDFAEPRRPDDVCRVANWRARTLLALGDVATALRAAELGARVAEENDDRGGLTYSLTLAAQIEVPRGNLARARRLLQQALTASAEVLELRVRPQILMQLAELESLDGSPADADARLEEASRLLADRPRRIWDSAYLTLARSRIARQRLNRDLICSLAHMLTYEAGVVSARAPEHPVVGALHTEAAMAWVAAGYLHQAPIALSKAEESRTDWLTNLELAQVRLFTSDPRRDDYLRRGREIVATPLEAGAPYLACLIAYRLAAQIQAQWHDESTIIGRWAVVVAQARGWKRLARSARVLAGAPVSTPVARGELITHPDRSRTLVAPHRGQDRARAESRPSLPDPFEDDRG